MENAEGDAEEAAVDKARLKIFHRVLLIDAKNARILLRNQALENR